MVKPQAAPDTNDYVGRVMAVQSLLAVAWMVILVSN
jgi:hypothetical protein